MRTLSHSYFALICAATTSLVLMDPVSGAEKAVKSPTTTDELRSAIELVLRETNTPGAGVAIVDREKIVWEAGIGLADRATGRAVTPATLFRAASISKSVVALAMLRLREAGKVRLEDKVSDLAGDVEFSNPWEAEEPLRLVHLLEHTSGFDEISLREFAASVPASGHRESLAFDPRPRKSRWRPGRFFSYSNANYILAGHILERVDGRDFDRLVEEEVFIPLKMTTATFLPTEAALANLATAHLEDGVTATPYEHMLGRASGALNTTPGDLARLVGLLLNRGTVEGSAYLRPESIERMETPVTPLSARRGVKAGYGLANYSISHKGHPFRGHDGALEGFRSHYGYSPDHGIGHVLMINSASYESLDRIDGLILAYLTRDWVRPVAPSTTPPPGRLESFAGYYELHTPRLELTRYMDRLLGIKSVAAVDGALKLRGMPGGSRTLSPTAGDGLFRGEDDPSAVVAVAEEDGGTYLASGHLRIGNYRRIAASDAWIRLSTFAFCMAATLSAPLFALVWIPRLLLGRLKGAPRLGVRALPALASVCLVAMILIILIAPMRPIERLGRPTVWSVGFWAASWLFAAASAAALVQSIRARRWEMNRWVRRHALIVSIANAVVLAYLAYWGFIGLRTWA